MERILRYDKNFISIYTYSMIFMFIYMFFLLASGEEDKNVYVYFFVMLSLFLINFCFYLFKFFNSGFLFLTLKILMLFVLVLFFYNNNLYILAIVTFFYIIICIEIVLIYSEKMQSIRNGLLLLTFGPLVISSIVILKDEVFYVNNMFFIIQYIGALYGIYKIIDINNLEMGDKIQEQKQLCETSEIEYHALQVAQAKVQTVYQQMSEQKYQLEQTNKELNRITSEIYIQNELLSYISSTLEIGALVDLVTDAIIGAVGVDTCSLIIHDIAGVNYYKSKSSYPVDQIVAQLKIAFSNSQLDQYFSDKNPHMNSEVVKADYPFTDNRQVGSIIIVPLIRNDVIYGLIISEHASKGFFVESNIQFFQSIATQINIAINNASLYSKMEEMATKDGLTGIYNRRHLQMNLNRVFTQVKEAHSTLTVSLFDIDKFKAVNDTYGHLFGDEAIKMVARIAHECAVKNGGFAGRYGGEEFVIVLPNISLQSTIDIMEKMHSDLKNEPLYYNRNELVYINISTGITAYPDFSIDPENLLDRADNAMYYSKKHGRGRITVDSSDMLDMH